MVKNNILLYFTTICNFLYMFVLIDMIDEITQYINIKLKIAKEFN